MVVIAGALNEAPHLPEHGQTVSPIHLLSQHLDAARRGVYQPQQHLQRGGLPGAIGAQEAMNSAMD